jgi:hypothetical protein
VINRVRTLISGMASVSGAATGGGCAVAGSWLLPVSAPGETA